MTSIEYHLAAQLDRNDHLEELVQRLWVRIEEGNVLLQSALLQLHHATGEKVSAAKFIASWHRQHNDRRDVIE